MICLTFESSKIKNLRTNKTNSDINVLNKNLISELKQCQITLILIIQFLGENLVKFQLRNLLCKNNKNNDYLELVFVVMLIIDNIITCSRKDHKIILAA